MAKRQIKQPEFDPHQRNSTFFDVRQKIDCVRKQFLKILGSYLKSPYLCTVEKIKRLLKASSKME